MKSTYVLILKVLSFVGIVGLFISLTLNTLIDDYYKRFMLFVLLIVIDSILIKLNYEVNKERIEQSNRILFKVDLIDLFRTEYLSVVSPLLLLTIMPAYELVFYLAFIALMKIVMRNIIIGPRGVILYVENDGLVIVADEEEKFLFEDLYDFNFNYSGLSFRRFFVKREIKLKYIKSYSQFKGEILRFYKPT
jgi:hypothetical protein